MSEADYHEQRAKWARFTDNELRVMEILFQSATKTRLYTQVKREQKRRASENKPSASLDPGPPRP